MNFTFKKIYIYIFTILKKKEKIELVMIKYIKRVSNKIQN